MYDERPDFTLLEKVIITFFKIFMLCFIVLCFAFLSGCANVEKPPCTQQSELQTLSNTAVAIMAISNGYGYGADCI